VLACVGNRFEKLSGAMDALCPAQLSLRS